MGSDQLATTNLNELLYKAAADGEEEKARMLLDTRADPNWADRRRCNYTCLMGAAMGGHVPVARLLVERKAGLDAASTSGWTALHWSAMCDKPAMVQFLLKAGANACQRERFGQCVLDLARGTRLQIVKPQKALLDQATCVKLLEEHRMRAVYSRLERFRLLPAVLNQLVVLYDCTFSIHASPAGPRLPPASLAA
eukprot:g71062.t1